jgi:transposase-like protein
MVRDLRRENPDDQDVIARVARQFDVRTESHGRWAKQAEINDGVRGGITTDDRRAPGLGGDAGAYLMAVRAPVRLPSTKMLFNDLVGARGLEPPTSAE